MNFIRKLPIPQETKEKYPVSLKAVEAKEPRDIEIKKIFTGESDKLALIIGPCSADSEEPVMEYAYRLAKLQEQVKDKLVLIPRVYTNKPRTTGDGYKGMLHQPDPNGNPDAYKGQLSQIATMLRIAFTNRAQTPDLYSILQVLGTRRVIERLQKACGC